MNNRIFFAFHILLAKQEAVMKFMPDITADFKMMHMMNKVKFYLFVVFKSRQKFLFLFLNFHFFGEIFFIISFFDNFWAYFNIIFFFYSEKIYSNVGVKLRFTVNFLLLPEGTKIRSFSFKKPPTGVEQGSTQK